MYPLVAGFDVEMANSLFDCDCLATAFDAKNMVFAEYSYSDSTGLIGRIVIDYIYIVDLLACSDS
jgi:hypothetical protein